MKSYIHTNIGDFMNIVYTGARSGIAAKVIENLVKENVHIYVTVETELQLKEVKKKYQNNKNINCLKLDITNKEDYNQFCDIQIDILVCNAAIGYGGSIAEIDMNKVRENFEVNVFSNFTFVQFVLKQMIERKKGRVIFISSLAGILPIPFLGSYCASKASIIKLAECLKLELWNLNTNIDIILIEPGLYHTGFNQVMLENKYKDMKKGYFKEEMEIIRKKESIFFYILEHQEYNSIVKKITKAILSEHPKHIYRAPFFQSLGAKIYQIFF